MLVLWGISSLLTPDEALTFLVAGILGLVTFIAVEGVSTLLELHEEKQRLAGAAVRSGLGGFLYLNVLDASFSFDGVIGAFAVTTDPIIIAIGLAILISRSRMAVAGTVVTALVIGAIAGGSLPALAQDPPPEQDLPIGSLAARFAAKEALAKALEEERSISFLPKPFTLRQLAERVKQELQKAA